MGSSRIISEEEKWNAVINCDREYDGLFYYAVKTTGVFCRPSCKAKVPLKRNTQFFNNKCEAVDSGYRPCKMCRPDISESIYEPNRELLDKIKKFMDKDFGGQSDLGSVARKMGFSQSHLTRLFKNQYSLTPKEYITELRISKSKELLESTNIDIFEIALEVGFKSLSTFYKCFKEGVGVTPGEYRKNVKREKKL